jgi:hypothetical protein
MRQLKFGFLALYAVLLGACQTQPLYDIGKGPVVLSPTVVSGFQKYLNTPNSYPTVFVISADGKTWASSTCPSLHCKSNHGERQIESCNSVAKRRGSVCKVFAIGDEIVWDGTIAYPGGAAGSLTFIITKSNPNVYGSLVSTGTADIRDDATIIGLRMKEGGRSCEGTADTKSGKWVLACWGGETYRGTFVAGSANLYEGIGTMQSEGKTVDFSIQKPAVFQKSAKMTKVNASEVAVPMPAALDAKRLCDLALDRDDRAKWSVSDSSGAYVFEAKRRGFSVDKCKKFAEK